VEKLPSTAASDSSSPLAPDILAPTRDPHQLRSILDACGQNYLYDNKIIPTIDLMTFKSRFADLKPGEKRKEERFTLAGRELSIAFVNLFINCVTDPFFHSHVAIGRIGSRRDSGKKLVFYDLEWNGERVQVVASEREFDQSSTSSSLPPFAVSSATASSSSSSSESTSNANVRHATILDSPFQTLHHWVRRGDVVACEGYAAATKTGEISLFATKFYLLSPVFHNLPSKQHPLKDKATRFANRHLDMLSNQSTIQIFKTRAKVWN
jgi:lysyl-tRNA synthetase class II